MVQTLHKVSLPEEDQFGLGMIRSLLAVCVEQTYQKRLDYQQRVLTMFIERLALPASILTDVALLGNVPANAPQAGIAQNLTSEMEAAPHVALLAEPPLGDP